GELTCLPIPFQARYPSRGIDNRRWTMRRTRRSWQIVLAKFHERLGVSWVGLADFLQIDSVVIIFNCRLPPERISIAGGLSHGVIGDVINLGLFITLSVINKPDDDLWMPIGNASVQFGIG